MNQFFKNNNPLQTLNDETVKYSQALSLEGVELVTEMNLQSAQDEKKKLTAAVRKLTTATKKNKGDTTELRAFEQALDAVREFIEKLRGRGLSKAERTEFKNHHFEERLNYIATALLAYNNQREKLQNQSTRGLNSKEKMQGVVLQYLDLMHHDFLERARLVNFLHNALGQPDEAPSKVVEFNRQAALLNNEATAVKQDKAWVAFLAKVSSVDLATPAQSIPMQKKGFTQQGFLARQNERLRQQQNRSSTFKPTMKR